MPKKDLSYQAICLKVATLLRQERCRQELSMSSMATRAGFSYQMISYVERGLRVPGLDTFLRMTSALDIDPADLLRQAAVEASSGGKSQR